MAKKLLVPVMPSERFYDAVVAAGDLLAEEGGSITFLFTQDRPPPEYYERAEALSASDIDVGINVDDDTDIDDLDVWREKMEQALADARDLLYERGISDDQINTTFADSEDTIAANVANEAAAGGYDMVVLARGYFLQMPDPPGDGHSDVAEAVQELREDGVQLLVT